MKIENLFDEVFSGIDSWNCIRCNNLNDLGQKFCKCGAPKEWTDAARRTTQDTSNSSKVRP